MAPNLLPWLTWRYDPARTQDENESTRLKQISSKTMQINQGLGEIAQRLGWSKKLTTHIARHSFASHADARVTDKRQVSGMLGHAKFVMTEHYLQDLRDDELDGAANSVYGA